MKRKDPTPEEIAAECLLIQETWTEAEKLKRLRVDLRPTFTVADGRQLDMSSSVYNRHHEQRELIQELAR